MPRRIDIELTSARDDGTWTWRAAGAREPRGTVPGSLLPAEPKVGDVLRVEAEFYVDGIEITAVVPPKRTSRKEPERIELLAPVRDEPLVITSLATRERDGRGRREGGRRGERRGDREGRPAREGAGRDPERGRRRERAERPARRARPEPPPMPAVERPKVKRLKPGKAHRTALLESLPEAHRPIAEQVVLGGLPAVRQAIEKQNAERAAAGQPPIAAEPIIEIAEQLVPRVRAAEWRDRAEAAQRDLEHIDLRDLRSVVSTADAAGKDEEARALARALQEGLAARVDAEHATWLAELEATLDVGRIVRALRVSSRPPKAGAPLPPELAQRLATGASEALSAEATPERWVAVLDALAFSPVRDKVIPVSLPAELHPDVRSTIARLATRIPKIAHIFEIEPDRNAPRPKLERRRKPKKPARPAPAPAAEAAPAPAPEAEPEPAAAPEPPTEVAEAPAEETPAAEVGAEAAPAAEPEAAAETPEPEPVVETAEPAADAAPQAEGGDEPASA